MQVTRCPHCDKPLADDVSLCPVCSTSLASPERMSSQSSTHGSNDASTDRTIQVPYIYGMETNKHVHISTPAIVKNVRKSRSITNTLPPEPTAPLPELEVVSQNVATAHSGDDETPRPGDDEGLLVGVRGESGSIDSDIMLSGTNWHKVVGTQPSRLPPQVPPRPPSSPRVPGRVPPSLFFWISTILLGALVIGGLFGLVVALGNNALHQPPPHHGQLSLQITPSDVSLGATIRLQGSNFSPDALVGLTRDINIPLFDTSHSNVIKTNGQGNFAVTVLVASDWRAGEHIIRAEDAITHKTAAFTITVTGESTSLRPAHLVLSSTKVDLGDGDIVTNNTQAITLNNAGGGEISWQTTVTQSWLLISPNSGTFSTGQSPNVVIAGDRANLKPNAFYTADIIFMSDAGKVSVPVTMHVSPLQPVHEAVLQLAPAVLSFTAVDGAASPPAQVVTVSNPGVRPLEWQASSDSGWLSVSPQSSILTTGNSQSVSITVNTSTLLPGTYSGRVTFTGQESEGVHNSPQSIFVSLTIVPQCSLQVLPGGLTFSSVFLQQAGPAPKVMSLSLSPGCSTPLSWNATTTTNNGGRWLTISATSGFTPSSPVISVNTSGLTPGNYTGAIIFSSSAGSYTVPVTYTMGQPPTPIMSTSPAVASFAGIVGQSTPTSQGVNITNTGGGTLQWTAIAETTVGGAWLTVSPASGNLTPNQTAALTVTATPLASLVPGTYKGTVTITGTEGEGNAVAGSPQTIPVTFTVRAPCAVAVAPAALTFVGTVGQAAAPAPEAATITATGACTHPLNWAATVATTPAGGTWLTATPAKGTVSIGAPSATDIEISPTGLAAGTYTGTVTVAATDGVTKQAVGTPQTVTVTFTVQPECTLQPPSVATLPFTTQQGSNPAPRSFTVGVTGNCKGSITIKPTVTMTSGTGWLTVTPASATITSDTTTFTVTVTSAALNAGSYTGSISLAAGTPAGSPQTVGVTLSVVAAPTLTVSPTALKLNSTTGTISQPITIGNSGGEPLNWTATLAPDAPDFVSLSSGSGTNLAGGTNTAVDVLVNATGVASGTYTTKVIIAGTAPPRGKGVAGSPATVPITIDIRAPTATPTPNPTPTSGPTPTSHPTPGPTPAVLAPSLQLSDSNLTFTVKAESRRPASQAITLTNSGGGTLTWTVGTPSQPWLKVTPTSDSDTAGMSTTLTFSVSIKGLAAGTYTATVDITPSAGHAVTVTVTLTVDE